MSLPVKFPCRPILCYVTDRHSLAREPSADSGVDRCELLLKRIAAVVAAGVDWIQIREKDLTPRECAKLVSQALALTHRLATPNKPAAQIFVNNRVDIAITERAAGVHLGENSLPVREVSRWLRSQPHRSAFHTLLVGASCHSKEGAISTAREGADYLFFGPVFATPSKAAFGPPQGLQRLNEVCTSVSVPVLAIGGITRENAAACLTAGAAGIAAIRLFQDASDLNSLVASLREGQS